MMALKCWINNKDRLIVKVENDRFRRTLHFDLFDPDFLVLAKSWIDMEGRPELRISTGGYDIVISSEDLSTAGVMVAEYFESLLLKYLPELLTWEYMLLKVGVGPYDHINYQGVRLGDVYTGGMAMIEDYVRYHYVPSGSIFVTVRKIRGKIVIQYLEVVSSDSVYKLENISILELLDIVDWRAVVSLLKERFVRQKRIAMY
ncbi:MAG: hypothetical protein SVT56_12855 [Chloroflexota bacterium]|nr:hypothetical protein [Chloroflexota bacterium]